LVCERRLRLEHPYWADRNSRWHRDEDIDPGTTDELLNEINDDPICIFWG
jgi:Protein of unknown function (DUF3024)